MREKAPVAEWLTLSLVEELNSKGVALEVEDGAYIVAVRK